MASEWRESALHEPAIMYMVTVVANSWREHAEKVSYKTVAHKLNDIVFQGCNISWGNNPRLADLMDKTRSRLVSYSTYSFLDLVRFVGNTNRHHSRACAIVSGQQSISPIRFFLDSSHLMIKIMLKLLYHPQSQSVVNEYHTLVRIVESLKHHDYREPDLDIFKDIEL